MKFYFDTETFSKQIKTKRVIELSTGLREVSKKTNISPATLSRIENQYVPDMDTLFKACQWLKVNPSEFIKTKK